MCWQRGGVSTSRAVSEASAAMEWERQVGVVGACRMDEERRPGGGSEERRRELRCRRLAHRLPMTKARPPYAIGLLSPAPTLLCSSTSTASVRPRRIRGHCHCSMSASVPYRDINVHSSPAHYAFSSPSSPTAPTLVVERPSGDLRLHDGKLLGSKRVSSIAGLLGIIKLRLGTCPPRGPRGTEMLMHGKTSTSLSSQRPSRSAASRAI